MSTKLLLMKKLDQVDQIDYYPIQTICLMQLISQHAPNHTIFELHAPDWVEKWKNSEIFHLNLRYREFCRFLDWFLEKYQQQTSVLQRWFAFQCPKRSHFLSNIVKTKYFQQKFDCKNVLVITNAKLFAAWAWTHSGICNSNGAENDSIAQGTSPQT